MQAMHQDAYGNVLSDVNTGQWASTFSGRHLTTKEYDPDSELYYFWQRWHIPENGFFASSCPFPSYIEHPYSFANANVTQFTDAGGLFAVIHRLPPIGDIGYGLFPIFLYDWLGQLYLCPLIWGDKLGDEFAKLLHKGAITDDWAHCVTICIIAQKCGKDAAIWAAWLQEWHDWFDYDDTDTNDDLEADYTGLGFGLCGKDCENSCEEAGY